jgi:hypothetical protein
MPLYAPLAPAAGVDLPIQQAMVDMSLIRLPPLPQPLPAAPLTPLVYYYPVEHPQSEVASPGYGRIPQARGNRHDIDMVGPMRCHPHRSAVDDYGLDEYDEPVELEAAPGDKDSSVEEIKKPSAKEFEKSDRKGRQLHRKARGCRAKGHRSPSNEWSRW